MNEPASDAHARQQAVEAEGSVLVQAPAGSGKTTLLTQRYLRLLAGVDSPERILALTFTRRAAEEMRERVLLALAAARRGACPAEMNPVTWSAAAAASRHLQSLGIDVGIQPARLRIETIDAFNGWLAAQLPIAAGTGSPPQVVLDAQPLYEEAAARALAHAEDDVFGAAVERVLALDDQRWGRLRELIASMLPSRDRWLPLLAGRLRAVGALDAQQLLRVREHLDEDLGLLVTRVLIAASECLGGERLAHLSRLAYGAACRLEGVRGELDAWLGPQGPLRAEAADLTRWRAAAWLLTTGTGTIRRRVTTHEGFPSKCGDKQPMLDLLTELERDPQAASVLARVRALPDPAYSDEQWSRAREVSQVLVLAAAQLDEVFREQGAADFTAVSLAALRSLGTADEPTDLALRLDYRLQHILVDEFQDTSGSQLDLVRQLTAGWQAGDGRSVFCVGDPMQSIYGFRQAEVRAFLELAEDGIGEVRFDVQRLRANFRSAKPVVKWINDCFSRVLPAADDRDRGAIAFRPSEAAARGAGPAQDEAAARDDGAVLQGFSSRDEECAHIAASIAAHCARHPQWRIAVLVRARSHARPIAAALRARRIAFRAVQIEPLQDRAAVRDVIMLLRALLHLGDRTAWLALLRAPWAGLSLADLWQLANGADLVWDAMRDDAVLLRLSEDGRERCARISGLLQAAFAVRNDTSIERWAERTWIALGGPACVAGAAELELAAAAFARLRDVERRGMPDPSELQQAFADLFADHGAEAAVEIMTIHKAKGLEFDMVVVPALDRAVSAGTDQLLLTHQFARTGRAGLVMAARPAVGAEPDALFGFLRAQLKDAGRLEAQRLLYVACTRAKHQLTLTAVAARDAAPAASLLAVLWPVVGAEFTPPDIAAASQAQGPRPPRGGPLLRVPAGWVPAMRADIAAVPTLAGDAPSREEIPVFDWAGETARRVGILVHAELQSMRPRADEESVRTREPHYRRWLSLHGVPDDRVRAAASRVVEALTGVLADPRGRWILQNSRDERREYALSGRAAGPNRRPGDVVRAVFDRSFIDDHGVRWVIDYKTSQHQGGGLEEFIDREVERYRPQLQRYAGLAQFLGPEPVRLGLYFPLMRAWREWGA